MDTKFRNGSSPEKSGPSNMDDRVRPVLAYASVLLTLVSIIGYIALHDPILLGVATVPGAASGLVFTYYFSKRK